MNEAQRDAVEIVEGNETLRTWMRSCLEGEGFAVSDEPSEQLADLLVVDLEARDGRADERIEAYRSGGRPVLGVGVGDAESDAQFEGWLSRPFSVRQFVRRSRSLLGLDPEIEADAPPGDGSSSEDRGDVSEDFDDLVTEDLVDEMVAGLEGAESSPETDTEERSGGAEEESETGPRGDAAAGGDVHEIDDASSMVLDVHDLDGDIGGGGGRVTGEPRARSLDLARLQRDAEELGSDDLLADPKTNPTLPDVPAYRDAADGEGPAEESSGLHELESDPGPTPGAGSTGSRRKPEGEGGGLEADSQSRRSEGPVDGGPQAPRVQSEELSPPAEIDPDAPGSGAGAVPPAFERELAEVAGLLAESWSRLGLTARWEDRAERLKRIFTALVERGTSGASDELDRIPPAHGFSGTLTVFPSFELIRLIREKGFLGRLEVSKESGGYVLYLDGNQLIGVDDLEGRSEAMLLDCLHQSGAVDDETYEELTSTEDDSLTAPLEMRLQTEGLVTEEQLLDARRTRAKWVVKEILNATAGSFAFIHGGDESGQPWPVNQLGLSVDVLLLELLRDGAVEWQSNEPNEPGGFVTAGHRMGDEQQTALALEERAVLNACGTPRDLDEIAAEMDATRASAESVVRRLRAVGFLEPTASPTSPDQAEGGGIGRSSSAASSEASTSDAGEGRTRRMESADDAGRSASLEVETSNASNASEADRAKTPEMPDFGGETENEALPGEPDLDDMADDSSSD